MPSNIGKHRRNCWGAGELFPALGREETERKFHFERRMKKVDMCIHLRWSSKNSETWRNESERTLNISCEH
jgi:hypothetical protein